MTEKATSKHLRSATELQLLVPVRRGFVEGAERLTPYSTRLKLLLEALSESFRNYWERDLLLPSGPIDQLQSIHNTQWAVHELPDRAQLVVASCFDRSWEEYFHLLVDRTGHLLDAIFMHCENYMPDQNRPGRSCREGYEAFADFIREHQLETHFFYMTAPDLSVDDVRRARKMLGAGQPTEAALGTAGEEATALLGQRSEREPNLRAEIAKGLRVGLARLFRLRALFPPHERFGSEERNAEETFDRAIASQFAEQLRRDPLSELSGEIGAWVTRLKTYAQLGAAPALPVPESLQQSTLDSIQGNILEAYAPRREHVTHGCMVLVQCDHAAALRALLTRLAPNLTSAGAPPTPERASEGYLNVALTYPGLKQLLPEAASEQLPKEFQEGMAARAGLLGDIGLPDALEGWQLPERNWPPPGAPDAAEGSRIVLDSVDVVLLFQQRVPPERAAEYEQPWSSRHPMYEAIQRQPIMSPASATQNGATGGVHILHVQPLARGAESHFKLSERGVSQPVPCVNLERSGGTVALHAQAPASDHVPLGELLLGYRDNRDQTAAWAGRYPQYFQDGSFLVVRKLSQDVEGFRAYTERQLPSADRIKALIVGRDSDGNPLVHTAPKDPDKNEFTFAGDREGKLCPLHSHMRRTNPRPQLGAGALPSDRVPRILRRSFAYGPTRAGAQGERGLLFMAYNTSIAGQFEVIQRWVNGGNSTGLASGQNDLLSGVPQPTGSVRKVWDGEAWRTLPAPERPFVSLRWGLYLFVPSLAGLWAMAQQPAAAPRSEACVAQGAADALISRLNALPEAEAQLAWKNLIEGEPSAASALVWQAARERAQPIRALNYGYLVAHDALINAVLGDAGDQFSVREYYARLLDTIGPHYLGFDPVQAGPSGQARADQMHACFLEQVQSGDYRTLAELPNQYIQQVLPRQCPALFKEAHNAARAVLAAMPQGPWNINVPELARRAFSSIGQRMIGIPGDEQERLAHFKRFILISRYAFQPYPDARLTADALACRQPLHEAYLAKASGDLGQLPMLRYLLEQNVEVEPAVTATMGALVGFAAPAVGCVVSAATQLIKSGQLLRHQLALENLPAAQWPSKASAIMGEAQARLPIPVILYRTSTGRGRHDIPGGAKVIISTRIAGGAGPQWLFGGNHGGGAAGVPPHGCPARNPAQQIMSGFLAFLLRLRNVAILSAMDLKASGPLPDAL